MEILFTNTEMELCWGSNKNNRFYKNLKALIPHMEYWVYGATTIKTSSSGCIVYFENSDVDKFLNDEIVNEYKSVATKILTPDNIREQEKQRNINIGEVGEIHDWYENDEGEIEEYTERIQYGSCTHISRNEMRREFQKTIRKFKSIILTNSCEIQDCLWGKCYVATSDAHNIWFRFIEKCEIYNAQRTVDCLKDLWSIGIELGQEWVYDDLRANRKKYILLWFEAYDVVRKLYLEFASVALNAKNQNHFDYPYDKLIEIYNQSIDKLIDIELNYNEYWEYILNTIKDIDNEKIKRAKSINNKAFDRWSIQESCRLLTMYKEGADVNSITQIFNRSLTSVIIQLAKLLTEELKTK